MKIRAKGFNKIYNLCFHLEQLSTTYMYFMQDILKIALRAVNFKKFVSSFIPSSVSCNIPTTSKSKISSY